jgi:cytochrome oxidase Cu insertion factor (SCO1/SenC/PrrC family)
MIFESTGSSGPLGARILVLLALSAGAAGAQQRPALGPADGAGLAPLDTGRVVTGTVAPDFTLESKDGGTVTLSQFRGKKTVILVFYRGHW